MDAIPLRQMFSILQKFSFPPSSLSLVSNWGGNKNTLAAQVLPKPQVSVTSIIFIVQNSIMEGTMTERDMLMQDNMMGHRGRRK